MRDRVEIAKGEYTEYLSLQFEMYKYLQNKSRVIIATTIAGMVAIGSLLSAGYLPSASFLSIDSINSARLESNTFLRQQSSVLITTTLRSLYFVSFSLFIISAITFYIHVVTVYKFTRINPVLSQEKDIILVETGKENTSDREAELEENNKILSKMYDHYQTSGMMVLIAFPSLVALLVTNIVYDEISNTFLILATIILFFYFTYVAEVLYHVWEIGPRKIISNIMRISEEILPGGSV
ncbi:hypothetical protein C482_09008 [Natrialba chahannaoensis JCM 10990]|uniref:Uncharacterized protein n=1 Tax=Natrialba chahannaoensis JCM 10990 TaxID=1227492 RepID=M0ANI6_9EURY|nr:hypothetical protein [Natrialba chahannaoensis]ELY99896.1 hypothetical protein C482_09008 [Natrialba chahannaoensis JCM 10990]